MRRIHCALIAAVFLSTIFVGCYMQSVYPLYTQDELRFDPGLEGLWSGKDIGDVAFVPMEDDSGYEIRISDEEGAYDYDGYLVGLGEFVYLDMSPVIADDQIDTDALIPLHFIARLVRVGDELTLTPIDFKWLEKKIETDGGGFGHFTYDGRIILSDETATLQQTILGFAGSEDAFGEPIVLHRAN